MKKLLLLLAAICCMMGANAQQFTDANGIKYNVTSSNTVEVIAREYAGYSGAIVIPATVTNGDATYNVTGIDDNAFFYCFELTSITIPSSVKSIGEYAFSNCKNLTSIILPNGLTSIGNWAFSECTGLESITVFASNPPTLGNNVFNVDKNIPVYVLDVDAYSNVSWGGFTNFQAISIDLYKQAAIDEIEAAMEDVSLSEDEEDEVNACITAIENVTTLSDENLTLIENKKNEALVIISQAAIRPAREAAIAAIQAALQGETGAYLTGLAQEYIDIINSATDEAVINNARHTALAAINAAIGAYQAGKAEALGNLPSEGTTGPYVKVILGEKSIKLYNPEKVEFGKE